MEILSKWNFLFKTTSKIMMYWWLNVALMWMAGNPRVTPEVTRDVCLLARMMAANLYYSQIEDLMFEVCNVLSTLWCVFIFVFWAFSCILFCCPNCFIYLFLHFLGSCQCGAAMRNCVLAQMNFTGPQGEMRNITSVCILVFKFYFWNCLEF